MEDVLAVYVRPRDGDCPLVCLDESSKQLIAETRVPIPMKAGRPARFDYEYERNGTANLFMMFAPLEGWRHVKVTDRHTAIDYAHVLKELADIHFAGAKTIVLVQDNLNIHAKGSLYDAFAAPEARRLVERFEWHYTPKHGSWLDLAESELGVLASQCLDRIPDKQTRRNRRLGSRPKCQPRQSKLALHNSRRTRQTQASLPINLIESTD
jgi:DDE superfamily endonuclease